MCGIKAHGLTLKCLPFLLLGCSRKAECVKIAIAKFSNECFLQFWALAARMWKAMLSSAQSWTCPSHYWQMKVARQGRNGVWRRICSVSWKVGKPMSLVTASLQTYLLSPKESLQFLSPHARTCLCRALNMPLQYQATHCMGRQLCDLHAHRFCTSFCRQGWCRQGNLQQPIRPRVSHSSCSRCTLKKICRLGWMDTHIVC